MKTLFIEKWFAIWAGDGGHWVV